jgi:ribosomal protein S3
MHCRELAGRLLADQIEAAGSGEARIVTSSKIATDQALQAEAEAAEDAAIRGAVQRGIERAVGLSAVEVGRAADQVRVSIRAARAILVAGRRGGKADRLRGELEELTGRRVRLDIREAPDPQPGPASEGSGRAG